MKKLGAILIAVALTLLAGSAMAEQSTVARNGSLAAYLNGEGQLYLPGNEEPVNHAGADALVSIDPYRVLFMSLQADGTKDLYMIDLGSFNERLVAEDVYDACMSDENTLYYVPGDDRTALKRMDMKTMVSQQACTASEPIDRMYNSADGLVFEQVDGTGTMIYNRLTGKFDSYLGTLPTGGMMTDSFELYLNDGDLYIRDLASLVSEHIDSGVRDYAVMNGGVYYLCNSGSATRLKYYDPADMTWQVVLTLDSTMERQLTASAKQLFLLDYHGQIYTADLASGELKPFAKVPDTSTYNLPKDYTVSDLKIEAMDGQLNVYAELEEASAQPSFSFIEFTSTSDSDQPIVRLLESYAIKGEETAWTRLKPAEQYSPLARGSRGSAVRAIQRPLYELGYYDYYIDGIFGPRTQYAVRLLQSDLDRPVTGVADSELQRIILNGGLPHYDAYLALTRGNRGLRVQIMQEKLRDLGYLGDAADGIFGANTQRAVQLFQSENGLDISDGATRETLKRLYSGSAKRCVSFIDLYPGYTGCRVRELNNRLQALYYLEYNPGGSYTADTAEAVRAFQRSAGLPVNGNATANVLRKLFSSYAPEAPGYITLRRGDENSRVEALQRRLKTLNYYTGAIDGYYGKLTEKAVKLFQKKVDLNASGVATVRTQALLFSKNAPVYVKPTVIGKPVITVERYDVNQDNTYYFNEDSASGGYATFSWYAEGEVKEFNVKVEDAEGRVLLNEKTLLTRTGVSLGTLELDKVYTLTITAYPEDGSKKHVTSDSVRFVRCQNRSTPEVLPVGSVTDPQIFIKTVLRTQGGVQYVQPGEVAFHWHADGEVDKYYVEIFNSDGDAVLTLNTKDEQNSIDSSRLTLGKTYTMFVYAIPARGTIENAATAAEHFALEDVSVPTPTPEPEEPNITPEPIVTVEPTATPEPTEVPESPEAEIPVPESQTAVYDNAAPVITLSPDIETVPETVTEAETESEPETMPETEPQPEAAPVAVTPPVLSFDTTIEQRDGITYVADDVLVMHWLSDGDVKEYYVEVVDSSGTVLAHDTTEENFIPVRQGSMRDGDIYTLNVTAYPTDGGKGVTSSASFALYHEEAPEEIPEIISEAPVEESTVDEPVVEEPVLEEPPVEEPIVEEPVLEEPPVEEPIVEESPVEEPIVEEPILEEPILEEPPVEEPVVEESPVDAAPEDVPGETAVAMDPETAAQVQNVLVSWGWLAAGSFEPGVTNEETLLAINAFEAYYNQVYGSALTSADGMVDVNTLALLLNQEGTVYPREG